MRVSSESHIFVTYNTMVLNDSCLTLCAQRTASQFSTKTAWISWIPSCASDPGSSSIEHSFITNHQCASVFRIKWSIFLATLIQIFFQTMKLSNLWGDLNNILASTEATNHHQCFCVNTQSHRKLHVFVIKHTIYRIKASKKHLIFRWKLNRWPQLAVP